MLTEETLLLRVDEESEAYFALAPEYALYADFISGSLAIWKREREQSDGGAAGILLELELDIQSS